MVGRLAGGQDALVFRIDRSGQMRWSLSGVPKAEEAVSPAEESIDLVEFNLALPGRIEKGSLSFLMGLRPEFNNLRSSIQHRVLTPDIDRAVADVRSEETQLPSLSVSVYEELP
ncbi:UNVERIFIED_CONTAM: hypothetical protein Sindi_0066600, partial [Sesamum indicum]